MKECKYRETDRTGLYIMVFITMIGGCQHGLTRSDVRRVVADELRKAQIVAAVPPDEQSESIKED